MDKSERKRRKLIVIDRYGGVLPHAEAFYICSIIYTAEAAFVSYARYHAECERGKDEAAAVAAIQESLTHSAALSRFFWTSSKSDLAQTRAAHLRKAFNLEGDSPLASRRLRNALEHYDERLDEFLLHDLVGMIFPDPVVAEADVANECLGHAFKLLDPSRGIFVVLGERFLFEPIIEEVGRILDRAYEFSGNGGRIRSR